MSDGRGARELRIIGEMASRKIFEIERCYQCPFGSASSGYYYRACGAADGPFVEDAPPPPECPRPVLLFLSEEEG